MEENLRKAELSVAELKKVRDELQSRAAAAEERARMVELQIEANAREVDNVRVVGERELSREREGRARVDDVVKKHESRIDEITAALNQRAQFAEERCTELRADRDAHVEELRQVWNTH